MLLEPITQVSSTLSTFPQHNYDSKDQTRNHYNGHRERTEICALWAKWRCNGLGGCLGGQDRFSNFVDAGSIGGYGLGLRC